MVNPQQYYSPPQQGNLAYLPTVYPPPYYPSSPPTPQQDPLEQLAKTVRLLDYIKGKEAPSSQPQAQPSQQQQVSQFGTPGAGSVAQFMPQTQADLDRQYQAMGLTQASGISTQTNSRPWQQVWGQQQASNNLEVRQQQVIGQLQQAIAGLDQEIGMAYKLIGDLVHTLETNLLLNREIEMQDQIINSLLPFIQVANIWASDALMHEQVLENVCTLLTDPGFLAYWAFHSWGKTNLTEWDLNFISEQFLKLLEVKGSVSSMNNFLPQPTQYASSMPFPPVPGNASSQQQNGIYAVINTLKNPMGPDTAKQLIRARNAGVI